MTTACIVQARLGSTRLPAKVLLPLPNGRTVLEEVLHRCKQIPGVDVVVAAIPDTAENDILSTLLAQMVMYDDGLRTKIPVKTVRGPEHDVLARYAKGAEAVKADVIFRVTSDCPLINPLGCHTLLCAMKAGTCDFAANSGPESFSLGWSCEAFTMDGLREAAEKATEPSDREHVAPYIKRHARNPVRAVVPKDGAERRPSLDTLADYVAIWSIFEQQMREAA